MVVQRKEEWKKINKVQDLSERGHDSKHKQAWEGKGW